MADASTIAALTKEYLIDISSSADLVSTDLRDKCRKIVAPGDDNFRILNVYADNASSATFAEYESFPTPGYTSSAKGYIPYSTGYAVTRYSLTGHAIDNAKGGNMEPMELEGQSAIKKHYGYKESLAITAAEAAIAKTGTYAGLTRATVNWNSYVEAIGTEAVADFDLAYDTLAAAPIGCDTSNLMIFSTIGVARKYINKGVGVAYNEHNYVPGQAAQLNKMAQMPQYGSSQWEIVRGMSTDTVLILDPALMVLVEKRPVTISDPIRQDDTYVFDITSCDIYAYLNPRFAAKFTSV